MANMESFLDWFIGFAEGDGCFSYTINTDLHHVDFLLVQKDPKILFKIRKQLGFGKVYNIEEIQYWRYQASNLKNCRRLFLLFNGHFRLTKTQKRFSLWANRIDPGLKINNALMLIHFNDAWLSGFIEADGGFYARVRLNKKFKTGKQFLKTFYITQKGEDNVLQQILILCKSTSHLQVVSPNRFQPKKLSPIFRLEISSFDCHQKLIDYLFVYPLRGNKWICFHIWYRMHLYQSRGEHLTYKGLSRLQKLCQNLGKHHFIMPPKTGSKEIKIQKIVHKST
jgi:LAGLIDADG endonuclease